MITPPTPHNEAERLGTLRALELLDTEPDERFDRITRLATRLFDVPIALVSLVDEHRQWFKSCQGLDASQTPRDLSFCGHAILGDDLLVVNDAHEDERFRDNPLVNHPPHLRFYAGYPLRAVNGAKLGTLCVIDHESRPFSDADREALTDLGRTLEQLVLAISLATFDPLTGVYNRRGFDMLARHVLETSRRNAQQVALLTFDLDYFKEINDTLGHAEGDTALRDFAASLRATFRQSDVIGRMGGDEFWVLLSDADSDTVPALLARLAQSVEERGRGRRYRLSYSVGSASCRAEASDFTLNSLSEIADAGMYSAKKATRRRAQRINVIR